MLDMTETRQDTAKKCLEKGLTRFMTEEMGNIFDGAEPAKELERYLQDEWYASGLTGVELEQITDSGIEIWNRIEPHTPAQMSDFAMRTDKEISDIVSGAVEGNMPDYSVADEQLVQTGYRRPGWAGTVVSAIAGIAMLASVAAANLSCTDYGPSKIIPAGVTQLETGSRTSTDNSGKKPEPKDKPEDKAKTSEKKESKPDDTGKAGCKEAKFDMQYDVSAFYYEGEEERIEQFMLDAKGAKAVHIGGFASPEDKPDMIKYGRAVNNDSDYNNQLALERAQKVAGIAKKFAKKHKLDIEILVQSFAETTVFGEYTYPNHDYDPNRTVVMSTRPFSDPDRNKDIKRQTKKDAVAPNIACTVGNAYQDSGKKAEKKEWKGYTPSQTTPAKKERAVHSEENKPYTPAATKKAPKKRTKQQASVRKARRGAGKAQHQYHAPLSRAWTAPPTRAAPDDGTPILMPGGGYIHYKGPNSSSIPPNEPEKDSMIYTPPKRDAPLTPQPAAQQKHRAEQSSLEKDAEIYTPPSRTPAPAASAQTHTTQPSDPYRKSLKSTTVPPADPATRAYEKKTLRQYAQDKRAERKAHARAEKEQRRKAAEQAAERKKDAQYAATKKAPPQAQPAKKPTIDDSAEKYFKMLREHQAKQKPAKPAKPEAPKQTKPETKKPQDTSNKPAAQYRKPEYAPKDPIPAEKLVQPSWSKPDKYKPAPAPSIPEPAVAKPKPKSTGDGYSVTSGDSIKFVPKTQGADSKSPDYYKRMREQAKLAAAAQKRAEKRPYAVQDRVPTLPEKKPSDSYTPKEKPSAPAAKPKKAAQPKPAKPKPKAPAITAKVPAVSGNSKLETKLRSIGEDLTYSVNLVNAIYKECFADGKGSSICTTYKQKCEGNDPRMELKGHRYSACNMAYSRAITKHAMAQDEYKQLMKSTALPDKNEDRMKKILEGYQKIIDLTGRIIQQMLGKVSNKKPVKSGALEQTIKGAVYASRQYGSM